MLAHAWSVWGVEEGAWSVERARYAQWQMEPDAQWQMGDHVYRSCSMSRKCAYVTDNHSYRGLYLTLVNPS